MRDAIALIAGAGTTSGPIPIALRYGGVEPHPTLTTDEAEEEVGKLGEARCVLVLDAGCLDFPAGQSSWRAFLSRHPALPAVIVACENEGQALSAAREPHRMLLVDPFDAAAVVAAVRRASSRPLSSAPVRSVAPALSEAG